MEKIKKDAYTGELFPDLLPVKNEASKVKAKRKKTKKTSEEVSEITQLINRLQSLQKDFKTLELQIQMLREENKTLELRIQKMLPKVEAYDDIMNSKSLFSTGVVAKSFGWSAVRLNKYLQDKKVQYFKSGIWMLYQKYSDKGYTGEQFYQYYEDVRGNKHSKAHTYWTMKGYEFIRSLLKKDGLLK